MTDTNPLIAFSHRASTDDKAVYETIEGGPELLAWFKGKVNFHDAEILSCELHRNGTSTLKMYLGGGSNDANYTGHVIFVFELQGISDLQLSGFSRQNVIGGLSLSIRAKDPQRKDYYDFCATDADYHIALDPCYGIDGFIRCKSVSVKVLQGRPVDDFHSSQIRPKDEP